MAAIARASTSSAEDLYKMHMSVLSHLAELEIHVVSQSADGSETERRLQRMVASGASESVRYTVNHCDPLQRVDLTVPILNGRPSVLNQDINHLQKTVHNQMQSGAHVLIHANFFITPEMLYTVGSDPRSPLYKNDLESTDKQDDRAAY